MFHPPPPKKKNANLGVQKLYFLPFQRFQLYTWSYVRIWRLRSCEHWRAATPFVIVGVGPGHFITHLPFLHRDVFRVVRFLSVWGLGTTTLYWCLLLSSRNSMKMFLKLAYRTYAMSAVEDARWILSRVLVHLTVSSFPKHDSKYDCKSLCDLSVCAHFHWLRMSPKLLQWRIHPPSLVSGSGWLPPPPHPIWRTGSTTVLCSVL